MIFVSLYSVDRLVLKPRIYQKVWLHTPLLCVPFWTHVLDDVLVSCHDLRLGFTVLYSLRFPCTDCVTFLFGTHGFPLFTVRTNSLIFQLKRMRNWISTVGHEKRSSTSLLTGKSCSLRTSWRKKIWSNISYILYRF